MPISVHDWLCRRANAWLLGTGGCVAALCERGESNHGERPDGLGWDSYGTSTLVECKASRADFHADKRKAFRDPECWHLGMGQRRFYMAPPGVLSVADIPERWGLLECHRMKVVIVKDVPMESAYATFDGQVCRNEMRLIFNHIAPLCVNPGIVYGEALIAEINTLLGDRQPWQKASTPELQLTTP